MAMNEVPGSAVEAKPQESADRSAYDDCLRALWLAPNEFGSKAYLTLLADAPAHSTREELRLLVSLVQRVALRRKWMVGVSL